MTDGLMDCLRVVVDDTLGMQTRIVQVRFPRSKKRRIQRKWEKDRRNYQTYKVQLPVAYLDKLNHRLITNRSGLIALTKGANRGS